MARGSKCLVIDANIARSAGGEEAQDEVSRCCRDFLLAVRDATKHKAIMTEAIQVEWDRHRSRFAMKWLASMYRKGRICDVEAPAHANLRHKIESIVTDESTHDIVFKDIPSIQAVDQAEKMRIAMLKDIHLIEAALRSEKIVLSLDDTMRGYFQKCSPIIQMLKQITWVNPCKEDEQCVLWLSEGAELEEKRLLRYSG